METKKITRSNITHHLLLYQLEMVGKDITVLIDDDRWRFNNPLTQEQFLQFKKYAIPLLQKTFHFNKKKAEDTFEWFKHTFGQAQKYV